MTLIEAINRIDNLKQNGYSREEKIGWLSTLDGIIKEQIIDTHEGATKEEAINEYIQNNITEYEKSVNEYAKINEVSIEEAKAQIPFREIKYKEAKEYVENNRNDVMFSGYNESTPLDTQLIVPAPYDDMYIFYLESKIDYANNEITRYNNSNAMFTSAFSEFQRAYNRTHMPKKTTIKFF